jgi:hypothetical protein
MLTWRLLSFAPMIDVNCHWQDFQRGYLMVAELLAELVTNSAELGES